MSLRDFDRDQHAVRALFGRRFTAAASENTLHLRFGDDPRHQVLSVEPSWSLVDDRGHVIVDSDESFRREPARMWRAHLAALAGVWLDAVLYVPKVGTTFRFASGHRLRLGDGPRPTRRTSVRPMGQGKRRSVPPPGK